MGQHTLYTAVMSGHMTKPDTKENQCCEMHVHVHHMWFDQSYRCRWLCY